MGSRLLTLYDWLSRRVEDFFAFFAHPLFAILAALFMVVLVATNVISLIVSVSVAGMWVVSFVWLARSPWLLKIKPIPRVLIALVVAGGLGLVGSYFHSWSMRFYHAGRSGDIHVLEYVSVLNSKDPFLNVGFENTGDELLIYEPAIATSVVTFVTPVEKKNVEDLLFKNLRKDVEDHRPTNEFPTEVARHAKEYFSVHTGLDPTSILLVKGGSATFLTVGYFHYLKPSDRPDKKFCDYWGGPK